MQYREMGQLGWKVSALGFGAMRLPTQKSDEKDFINEKEAIKMIRYAIDHGVNYLDTAWPYHNQASEPLVAKALKEGYREKVHLATKLPMWEIKEEGDFEKYLEEQLTRLETDYLDIYLFHALSKERWDTVQKFDLIAKMEQAKKEGKIRHFGFSFHDSYAQFKEIIDAYEWEVCQIQYNYLDQEYQAGRAGLEYAAQKGVAVIVMEPLRGGKLVESQEDLIKIVNEAPSTRTLADWGLQYIWNHPEVAVVLSGMSTMDQVMENVESANKSGIDTLTESELEVVEQLRQIFAKKLKVNCTQCKYCMPCPAGVDIPNNLTLYNRISWEGENPFIVNWYKEMASNDEELSKKPNQGRATLCIECGQCLEKCPQHIDIPNELKNVVEIFEKII